MKVHVYQAIKPTFRSEPVPWPDGYNKVATVEVGNSLDDIGMAERAFQLTKHIDRVWWDNPGVTKTSGPEVRSTSVGDVVVLPDGRALRCEMAGWTPVN